MDPTAAVTPIASAIYQYGGWGLSSVLMVVIWRMARYILDLHKEQKSEAKEQYGKLIETLMSNKMALESLTKALQDFMRNLEHT